MKFSKAEVNPPSRQELLAARSRTVPDVIDYNLKVLFCGINPGLYTAWIGHHFGRPGNRFWPAMYAGGFTPRLYDPREDHELLKFGLGITNLVARATNRADELSIAELRAGKSVLLDKLALYQPKILAVLGISSYRVAFEKPHANIGLQSEKIGDTRIWILPNPSGLNAHYTPDKLKKVFQELYEVVFSKDTPPL